jgi:hypothetical protein
VAFKHCQAETESSNRKEHVISKFIEMNPEEKFDKIFKKKVGESEFPFDENNWVRASRLIDAERKAAGAGKYGRVFLLFGTFFLATATVIFLNVSIAKSGEMMALASNSETAIENSKEVMAYDQETLPKSVEANMLAFKKTVAHNSAQSKALTSSSSTSKKALTTGQFQIENILIKNTESNRSQKKVALGLSQGSRVNNQSIQALLLKNGSVAARVNKSNANSSVSASNKNLRGTMNGQAGEELALQVNQDNQNAASENIVTGGEALSLSNVFQEEDRSYTSTLTVHSVEEPNEKVTEVQALGSEIFQIGKKEENLLNTSYDFKGIYEDYFTKKRRKTHYLNAELGTTYLFGWQNANGKDGRGFNSFVGLNYGLYFSKFASISAGAQLYNVSNIKNSFYSQLNYNYDFGYNGHYTEVTTNSLYYFAIPAKVTFHLSRQSKLGLGVNTAYVFNGKSTVTTYTEVDNVKSDVNETKAFGYYEGVNKMNVLLSAFYTQRLNRRFALSAEFVYGLSDTFSNSVSNNNFKENNVGLRLGLQYLFFDK